MANDTNPRATASNATNTSTGAMAQTASAPRMIAVPASQ